MCDDPLDTETHVSSRHEMSTVILIDPFFQQSRERIITEQATYQLVGPPEVRWGNFEQSISYSCLVLDAEDETPDSGRLQV